MFVLQSLGFKNIHLIAVRPNLMPADHEAI